MLRLELVRATKMGIRADRIIERDVHQMAEVVVVPRRLWSEARRVAVGTDGDTIVAEQRMAKAHERMKDVVFGTVAQHPTQVQRGLPRVVFEVELREVPVREERSLAPLGGGRHHSGQQTFSALRRCLESFFRLLPEFFDRACPLTHLHSYSWSIF